MVRYRAFSLPAFFDISATKQRKDTSMAFYGITFEPKTLEPITFVAPSDKAARIMFAAHWRAEQRATEAALYLKEQRQWLPVSYVARVRSAAL